MGGCAADTIFSPLNPLTLRGSRGRGEGGKDERGKGVGEGECRSLHGMESWGGGGKF